MIEVRLKTEKDKYSSNKAIKYVIQLGELKSYLTEKALIELKTKLNTFAIPVVSISLPSRKDYDNRKLKAMYFKKDTSVGNSVLFIKGEQWQPYNWNYERTIDYLKEGRLGYEC